MEAQATIVSLRREREELRGDIAGLAGVETNTLYGHPSPKNIVALRATDDQNRKRLVEIDAEIREQKVKLDIPGEASQGKPRQAARL